MRDQPSVRSLRPLAPSHTSLPGDHHAGDLPDQFIANRDGEVLEARDGHDEGARAADDVRGVILAQPRPEATKSARKRTSAMECRLI